MCECHDKQLVYNKTLSDRELTICCMFVSFTIFSAQNVFHECQCIGGYGAISEAGFGSTNPTTNGSKVYSIFMYCHLAIFSRMRLPLVQC